MKKQHYDPFKDDAPKHSIFGRGDKRDASPDGDKAGDPVLNDDVENTERIEPEDDFERVDDTERIETSANHADDATKRTARDTGDRAQTADPDHMLQPIGRVRRNKFPISALVSAGFWIRVVALSIDLIVAYAFSAIFASPIIALVAPSGEVFPAAVKGIFFYLYFVLFTYFTNGQTLGKMITGIRVIHPEEERLSFTTVFVREGCCRLIQTTFTILYLITPFTERKRNIGDFLADTYVVKEELYTIEREHGDIFYAYSA